MNLIQVKSRNRKLDSPFISLKNLFQALLAFKT